MPKGRKASSRQASAGRSNLRKGSVSRTGMRGTKRLYPKVK